MKLKVRKFSGGNNRAEFKEFSSELLNMACNISTWSNQPVALFLNKVINPKDADTKIYKLKPEQIETIKEKLGSEPKVPASFKEIYTQFKQSKLEESSESNDDTKKLKSELDSTLDSILKQVKASGVNPKILKKTYLQDDKSGEVDLFLFFDWEYQGDHTAVFASIISSTKKLAVLGSYNFNPANNGLDFDDMIDNIKSEGFKVV